ncbi:AbfB domain-containing protein [Nucisporomicrobium flavum]|uniref:AbfB domain-containing protein n=1 Tax=Nucisporomicrobium flavum TaxID=2785915 RepID=UPI0018F7AFE3|nr:AbfB domain-containing protein [Nucisporomicrobium flavum]
MTGQAPEPPRPAGTVYGRGGVDVREPRPGLLTRTHPAVTALVCAGIVGVLALGYTIWRATGDEPEPLTRPSAPAPSSAAPSGPSRPRLAAGSWLLAPLDDPDTHLTSANGFAALAPDERMVLIAGPGLADPACFSFRAGDGRYLRHFDYRLRFDATDDSDLFRNDATFCPQPGLPAGTVRLSSKNYPDHVVHRRGTDLYIDEPDGSATFTADSSFQVQPAA